MTGAARDVKVFVPAKDFALSKDFYRELGWRLNWDSGGGLAELELGGARFLLQDFYVREWAENFMLYVLVDDADAWIAHAETVTSSGRFPGTRTKAPEDQPWGDRVGYVWDPAGVLLHIAQPS